jgi:hypothetical protein
MTCCQNSEEKKLKKDGTPCCGGGCGACDDCDCQWNEETQSCSCGKDCACHEISPNPSLSRGEQDAEEEWCCGGGCGCADGNGVMISEEDFAALQAILGRFDDEEEPSEEAMVEVEEILKKYKS